MRIRILCTGSRSWTDEAAVRSELAEALDSFPFSDALHPSQITIVHGGCPKGADEIVDRIAHEIGFTLEVHPADTRTHGSPFAFYRRNQDMADRGAALCLAFWNPSKPRDAMRNAMDGTDSRGTADTIARAVAAGIPVRIVPEGKR